MFIKSIVLFFKGDSINKELKEDIEAKKILETKQQTEQNAQTMLNAMFQTTLMQAAAGMQQNMMEQNNKFVAEEQIPIQPLEIEETRDQSNQQSEDSNNDSGSN